MIYTYFHRNDGGTLFYLLYRVASFFQSLSLELLEDEDEEEEELSSLSELEFESESDPV